MKRLTGMLPGRRLAIVAHSRAANLLLGLAMAGLWTVFAIAHVGVFLTTGNWAYLLFCMAESAAAVFFVLRTTPVSVSASVGDWLLAIGATFAPFMFRPSDWGVLPAAGVLLVVGSLLQLAGLLALNRSFGLVAAQREIKSGGVYGVVRHPLYASYLLSFSGYVLANTSLLNVAVFGLDMGLLVARMLREERYLARDPVYRAYMQTVKYRIVPLIF